MKFGRMGKLAGTAYHMLKPMELELYSKLCNEDKIRYDQEMEHYNQNYLEFRKSFVPKTIVQPQPKVREARAMSAFNFFTQEISKSKKKLSRSEVSDMWKLLSQDEKRKYDDMSLEDKKKTSQKRKETMRRKQIAQQHSKTVLQDFSEIHRAPEASRMSRPVENVKTNDWPTWEEFNIKHEEDNFQLMEFYEEVEEWELFPIYVK